MTTLTPTRLASMPRVNLLPPEIAAAQRLRQLKVFLGLLVAAAFVVVLLAWFFVGQQMGGAEEDLAAAQQQEAQLQKDIDNYAEVPEVYGAVDAAQQNLVTAMTPEIRVSFYLNDLSLTMPNNSRLTSLTFLNSAASVQLDPANALTVPTTPTGEVTMGSFSFSGRSTTFDAVASWLQTLSKGKGVTSPTVTAVTEGDDENTVGTFYDVDSNAFLSTDAASERYLQIEMGE
jgi:Tfp pilus assembly protein PilN